MLRLIMTNETLRKAAMKPSEKDQITPELLLNTMAEGVMVINLQGQITCWNPALVEMTGFSENEMLGEPALRLRSPGCRGAETVAELLQENSSPHCVNGCECRMLNKAGEPIPVLINARVLHGADGERLGLLQTITDFRPVEKLREELLAIESKIQPLGNFHGLIGNTGVMQRMQRLIRLAAESDVTTLIQGESGTGKELCAAAIHALSNRVNEPFVKVNCGALTENLLESELFGHVKGAFTGAYKDRIGRFEAADGGTIFLDEIGEISLNMQVKLLRVLQESEFERVGDGSVRKVNVRIIAATNRDLLTEVGRGHFREDLFYRLHVFPLNVPALRERREDIPLLAQYFLDKLEAKTGKLIRGIESDALKRMQAYRWPGNVRELENALEYGFVVCADDRIRLEDLPDTMTVAEPAAKVEEEAPVMDRLEGRRVLRDPQRLAELVEFCYGNKAEVGRRLGVSRTAVWKWMQRHGIEI